MKRQFVFSMWTYNDISEFTPDELEVWAELGMTIPMLPSTATDRNPPESLLPWLDKAQQLGLEVIVNYCDMSYGAYMELGAEAYEKRIKPLYDAIGHHPAVHGFCIGDEPFNKKALEASLETIRINKKLAPHLTPYLNYTGATENFDRETLGDRDLSEYMKYAYEQTGTKEICYDVYTQQINEHQGKTDYYISLKKWTDAGKAAGNSDVWGCFLSSGHHVYAPPKEVDYRFQINTAAACGMRGILWFRLYDRENVISYYGSPIDEFGDKTEGFYGMKRCQRRFSRHFGEIFMKLHHIETYTVNSSRGVYPTFAEANHPVIKDVRANDEGIVSFFKDDEGREYLCFVNCETRFYGDVYIYFDKSGYRLVELTQNGRAESYPDGPEADCEVHEGCIEFTPIPAALHLFRIDKK